MKRVIVTVFDDVAGSVMVYDGEFGSEANVKVITVEDQTKEPDYDDLVEVFGSEWNYMEVASTKLYHEDMLKPGRIDRNQGA